REWRFQARLALLTFEAFQERRLLAANVGASAVVHDDIEGKTVDVILADEIGRAGLIHGRLQALALADEFAADVDEAGIRPHGEASDQTSLDQQMRIVPHDLAVLAGAGLGLIGVDHEIMRAAVGLFGHERPFQAGRKTGSAAATQPRSLHLIDDPIAALLQDGLGAVPGAPGACAVEAPVVEAVEIGEDAVLVLKHQDRLFLEASSAGGFGIAASRTLAGSPAFLASASLTAACCHCPPLPRA